MSKNGRIMRIDDPALNRFKNYNTHICKKCRKEFQIGDLIISNITGARTKRTKHYHKECWDKMHY